MASDGRHVGPAPLRPSDEGQDRLLARVVPAPQQQEQEDAGAQAECYPGQVRGASGPQSEQDREAGGQEDAQLPPWTMSLHPIGTLMTRVNCSNSDTRSLISISQVPPGLSTTELRM